MLGTKVQTEERRRKETGVQTWKIEKPESEQKTPGKFVPTIIHSEEKYDYATIDPMKLKLFFSDEGISMKDFVEKNKPKVAMNGGFFDINDKGYFPTGLLISDSKLQSLPSQDIANGTDEGRAEYAQKAEKESKWYNVFFVKENGFCNITTSNNFYGNYSPVEYAGIKFAIEAGPLLAKDGIATPEEFGQRKSAQIPLLRSAIGVRGDGAAILFVSKEEMTYAELAHVMITLGAKTAMSLDGGPSSAFYGKDEKSEPSFMTINSIIYAW
ncbi:MAG: phosphodiester glycosidase family protein [Candidatus Micrarchaeia archaeon]